MSTKTHWPCGTSKKAAATKRTGKVTASQLMGPPVEVKAVTEVANPEELILNCMPAFGSAYIRRIYQILSLAIGRGVPLIVSVAGPVTVSNQHRSWLIPLIEAGWVAYITVTDAICYHDGHDSLRKFKKRPIREVAIEGMDEQYGKAKVIRVTDTGFKEQVLFDQDALITTILRQKEFQRKMAGPEFRNKLGKYYASQEETFGVKPGLLSTCWRHDVPVFVGAPGDGSAYLNHVKLWALKQRGLISHRFEIDVAAEVFESCAYHHWGLKESELKQLAVLILGGGVSKNFTLQPEPTLGQIFLLDGIRGYDYDVQIVGAPVTDGSLTSCKPAEAHTWGKVSLEALESTTESFQTDYSTVMPLIAWALLEKRKRLSAWARHMGEEVFAKQHPELKGFVRNDGFRLYSKREELVETLLDAVTSRKQFGKLKQTWKYPLQHAKKPATK
jgi:deoxyhypusine synthase